MIQINIKIDSGKGFWFEFDEEPILRDLFAAAALAGLNAFGHPHEQTVSIEDAVRQAYYQADLMIEKRKERQS